MINKLAARLTAWIAIAALMLVGAAPLPALAQTYPTNNPVYIPTAVLPATNCSTACTVTFNTNGLGSVTFRVSGSATGISITPQVSNDRGVSPTYTNVQAYPIGGMPTSTITANGLYRVNTQGLTSVRLNVTAVTGTLTVTGAGSPAEQATLALPVRKATYSAAVVALAPAASATDFLTLTGSATATIEITDAQCTGISTANSVATVEAVTRSTADTSGTPVAMTAVPHDSNLAAATAAVTGYSANPTVGTLVGIVRAGKLSLGMAASSTMVSQPLEWKFGEGENQSIILRGTGQVFALNGAGASFSSGAALNCSVTWLEY